MANAPTSHDLTTQCLNTIRTLAMDAVERASSGHPGTPMGCAEIGFHLFTRAMRYDPRNPDWIDRDRFVLSAGHASMLLYALLHLTGYELSLEEIRRFRQWGSATPGHPEYGHTPGVEVTTGPLGQGFGHGVGMALAAKMAGARFNTDDFAPITHRVFGIVSDGDVMEGVASEAASLAGHLGLGNLVYVYDDNRITIDGSTDLAFSEDVESRFRAYGWHTRRIDGHDLDRIAEAVDAAVAEEERPSLIVARTHIAHGSPGKQDTAEAHGAPLGEEEIRATKRALGWPEDASFLVPDEVREYFGERVAEIRRAHDAWQSSFEAWRGKHPERAALLDTFFERRVPDDLEEQLLAYEREHHADKEATRASCGKILQRAAELVPNLIGGSADLAGSTKTMVKGADIIGPGSGKTGDERFAGRSIHYGVREHAMGTIVNGMTLHRSFRPVAATFLIFSDYMRPSIRLAALMDVPSLFVFSHDSVFLGEDGPTHQPIEHLASLRAMPNLTVWRPADAVETTMVWAWCLRNDGGPCCFITSRQGVPALERGAEFDPRSVFRGAYVLADPGAPDFVIVATGSEVHVAAGAAKILAGEGVRARVVSMPSVERFLAQDHAYREQVLPPGIPRVSVEAAATYGWERIVGDGLILGIDRFGASAPTAVIAEKLGFTPEAVAESIREWRDG